MKHRIQNNQIIQSGLPSHFIRENEESFWGGYELRTDLHYEDGWRDEVAPEYNPLRQSLQNIHYDPILDIVTYDIIPKLINVEDEKVRHLDNLADLRREIAIVVTQIKLAYDPEPVELTELIPIIRGLYAYAKQEITNLTEENVVEYVLRGPQVQGLLQTLNSML